MYLHNSSKLDYFLLSFVVCSFASACVSSDKQLTWNFQASLCFTHMHAHTHTHTPTGNACLLLMDSNYTVELF